MRRERSYPTSGPSASEDATSFARRCRAARLAALDAEPASPTVEALRHAAEDDSGYFSVGAMLASADFAVRTGHLSALVGELAESPALAGGEAGDEATRRALARLAVCAVAWLSEISGDIPGD